MKGYPEYKDSGVEWTGDIPANWDTVKLKYISSVVNGSTPSSSVPEYWDGNNIWVTPEDLGKLNTSYIGHSRRTITEEGLQNSGASVVPTHSVILTTRAPIGNLAIASTPLSFNQGCKAILLDAERVDYRFIYFLLTTGKTELQVQGKGTTFLELSSQSLRDFIVSLPSLPEQHAIATYLDRKTAEIDTFIAKKRHLIELLKEERTALINNAVTKGIHPGVEMKDSGIEWLGEIPKHWEVKKLKYLLDDFNYRRIPLSSDERGKMTQKVYDYYGASGVIDKVDEYLFDGRYILIGEDGANLLTRSTALAFIAEGKFWVNNHAHILKPMDGNDDYYVNLLESLDFTIWVSGSAQPKLTQENLANIPLLEPPRNEQDAIADFIINESRTIDLTISKIENEITLLQEYRTALISEVVTGKVDVRGYQVEPNPLSEASTEVMAYAAQ